jgi:hypothetical protein
MAHDPGTSSERISSRRREADWPGQEETLVIERIEDGRIPAAGFLP